jgi:hypothetical protein
MAQEVTFGPAAWAQEAAARRQKKRYRRARLRELAPILGWLAVVAAAVVTELTIPDLREWYLMRPVTAGIISGGIVLAPLVYLVERWTRRREQRARAAAEERACEEWREPAREAIETYMEACYEARGEIERELTNAAAMLERKQPGLQHLPDLVVGRRGWFMEFRQLLDSLARRSSSIALALVPAVAPYPPLTRFIQPVAANQRQLRHAASVAGSIDARAPLLEIGGASPEQLRSEAERLASLLSEWAHGVYQLQGNLSDADDELSLPPERRRLRSAPEG